MLGLLTGAALLLAHAGHPGHCTIETQQREQAILLRPSCPVGRSVTAGAVRAVLERAGDARELRISFGRIEQHAWLSALLARQASSSRHWDPKAGKDNAYVAAALRGMPEFTALFGAWQIAGMSVEKVLVKPAAELPLPAGAPIARDALLPYDAILWVTLKRP